MIVLSGGDVRTALTPELAYQAAEAAFRALAQPTTSQPLRTHVDLPTGTMLLKPAATPDSVVLKSVMVTAAGVRGFVALLDARSGELVALLDAAAVTELRTAAASAMATQLLAPPGASRLGLLGAGAQARSHLTAIALVRPLEQVLVWSPSGARDLLAWAATQGYRVAAAPTPESLVRASDVVCTVTSSREPVLLGDWLQPGTHVNAVGAFRPDEAELDRTAVARSTVFVDQQDASHAEAGALRRSDPTIELSDVVVGLHPGRTSDDEVTLFSSTGLAVQDLCAAQATVAEARRLGLGADVPWA